MMLKSLLICSFITLAPSEPAEVAAQRQKAEDEAGRGAFAESAKSFEVLAAMPGADRLSALDWVRAMLEQAWRDTKELPFLCRAATVAEHVVAEDSFKDVQQARYWEIQKTQVLATLKTKALESGQANCRFDATGTAIPTTKPVPKVAMLTDDDFAGPVRPKPPSPHEPPQAAAPRPVPPPKASLHTDAPRPPRRGVGFLVAGGTLVGTAAMMLPFILNRSDRARTTYSEWTTIRGETDMSDPTSQAVSDMLGQQYRREHRLTVGLSLTAAAMSTAGVVLLGIGGHRAVEAKRRYSLTPAPRGLAFTLQF